VQEVTNEYLKKYQLFLTQPAKGYRYSIDSFLLAEFLSELKFQSATEIGGGCGIISFLLTRMKKNIKQIEIFEIQQSLFNCLAFNAKNNNFNSTKIQIRNEDAKFALPSFIPEIIFSNPPFRVPKSGKISPNREKAIARHEFFLNLDELFQLASNLGNRDTKFALIHLFERKQEIEKSAKKHNFFPEITVAVKPFKHSHPKHIIFLFSKKQVSFVAKSFFIYEKKGIYTKQIKALLE
jgi:tRNA1Val (adenine37-N6)-methyltransferase